MVPFKLKSGFTVAQLQVGYKGYIQLGYRAGWKFKAVPVYKCDNFDYKFGGFEDDIVLEPNYEARNEDDGNWIFKNLVGVIVYAKDKDDYIVTEFVAFKKLEKLRLKSQNQVKDKLQYIWLDWAEEMYKAKALKYVVTRLPIEDDVQELISSEDNVHRIENVQSPAPREPEIQNINDINSLKNKPAQTIDVEVSAPKELAPKELITKELMNRGLTQEEAGKWCYGKSDDIFNSYLNDPASIDTILEEIRGF